VSRSSESLEREGALESWAIRASTAVFGLAVAVALAPRLQWAAEPGQLPGAMQAEGLSPRGPLLQWMLIVVLPFAGALAAKFVIPKLRESRWAVAGYCVAMATAPLPLMHYGNLRHVVLHGIVAGAIVAARRVQPRFSRADIVLLPVLLSTYLALLDVGFGKTPAATFLRSAMILFALRLIQRSPSAFTLAPLALLFQMGWLERPVAGSLALTWIIVTPFLARTLDQKRLRRTLTFFVYPVAVPAYVLALLGILSPAPVDFFEDGHDLMPAAEMRRGEVPYRDILPMHGLVTDGGLSWMVFATGHDSAGAALKVRRAVSALNLSAVYFVALAVTGSAEAGVLAALLTIFLFPATSISVRTLPALFALAAASAATLRRSRVWLIVAAVLCAVSFVFSIDFAIYSTLVVLIAAVRARVWAVVASLLTLAVAAMLAFWPVLREAGNYVMGTLSPPECVRNLSAMAALSSDPHCLSAMIWLLALIASAVGLASRPLRSGRRDGALLVAMWVVVAGLSYVERRHLYYEFAVGPLLVTWLWHRRRARYATVLIVVLVILSRPFAHVFDVATTMRRQAAQPSNAIVAVPRTEGAIFEESSLRGAATAKRYLDATLQPGETYIDFANAALLYYLVNRDAPLPWMEVPLYESAQSQREVIATMETDPRIRAALIAFPGGVPAVDFIPNKVRAPLVWQYIEQNFRPGLAEDGVEVWLRNSSRTPRIP